MRKIEKQMNAAIRNRITWHSGNTAVNPGITTAAVLLHGNLIAIVNMNTGEATVEIATLRRWDTPTTKSRLRALGVDVYTKRGQTYVNGEAI